MKNSISRKNKRGLFRASSFGALLLCIIGIGLLVSCSAETADSNAEESPKTPITALTYSNATISVSRGSTIPDAIPTLTPTGASATYTINPALPAGLSLDSDGKISGATTELGAINYVVTATGTGNYSGTKTATINITVQVDDPPVTVTATEIARSDATFGGAGKLRVDQYRIYHALLSLSASAAGEFTLGLRASATAAPSTTDLINAGGVIVRNLTTTPINVHFGFHMDAAALANGFDLDAYDGDAASGKDGDADARAAALTSTLQPGTAYTLYATLSDSSGDVLTVMTLQTDALPADGGDYFDMPLDNITYTIRLDDPQIILLAINAANTTLSTAGNNLGSLGIGVTFSDDSIITNTNTFTYPLGELIHGGHIPHSQTFSDPFRMLAIRAASAAKLTTFLVSVEIVNYAVNYTIVD